MGEAYRKWVNVAIPNNTETYTAMIFFMKTDVDVSEEIQLPDLHPFISSVGGNLGLFIGFSFLSLLLKIAQCTRKLQLNNLCQTPKHKWGWGVILSQMNTMQQENKIGLVIFYIRWL